VLLASSLLALGLAEGALRRAFGPPPRWTDPQEVYLHDERLGHRLAPHQRAFTHGAPVETNALGLRDRDYGPKPPGAVRILALGDSQTFGLGLALEDTWPKQLERALREAEGGVAWEVVNAGVPGTDVWQHERMLETLAPALEPDHVVLGFYVNDLSRPIAGPLFPIEAQRHWTRRIGYVAKRSALVSALLVAGRAVRAALWGPPPSQTFESHLLAGTEDPAVERGWEQVEASLGAMAALGRELGFGLTLLAIPRRDQVSGAIEGAAYQRRLAALAAAKHLGFVDPLAALRAAYAERGPALFVPWDGHNAAPANRALASALREELLDRLHELRREGRVAGRGQVAVVLEELGSEADVEVADRNPLAAQLAGHRLHLARQEVAVGLRLAGVR
jgi:hypothetical protein